MEMFIWSAACSSSQASDVVGKLGAELPNSLE